MVGVRHATYSVGMNDPWSTFVDALLGQRRATPQSWPARRIHRMMDDTRPATPSARVMPLVRPLPTQMPRPLSR
jgi:hypothetical protein